MSRDDISLDAEAQNLFEQFGGMESWKQEARSGEGADRLAESLLAEQKRLDTTRILLIELSYLLSCYLADDGFARKERVETNAFKRLVEVINQLAEISGHLGCAFIRYRGTPVDADLPEKYDYEVVIGNTAIDAHMAPRVATRNGTEAAQLPDRLIKSFAVFADYGVNNIFIQVPENLSTHLASLQLTLRILSGFRSSRQTGEPIIIRADDREVKVPLINDENLFPDPNLTIVAGINSVSSRAMESLVEKVDQWLRRQAKDKSGKKYADVYNAALDLPKIRAKLKKPLVELNNIKWLFTEDEEQIPSEKAYIARLALDTAGKTPQKVAKMIQSIYGDDYHKIDKNVLGERLNLSSDLLCAAEKQPHKSELKDEMLGNLNQRLDAVRDQVFDEVQVRELTGEELHSGRPLPPGVVHSQIFEMVNFFKGRSGTRKKMVGMIHRPVDFEKKDYQILARDYRIELEDAQAMVEKLKGCFNEQGRFRKSRFHEAINHFRQYEQKIFGFLWHHLKDAILPEDRVPFLNALQSLTARMKQPKRAFKILLEDICADPEKVQFSDNKAMMLANLIVHRPDKALADYDITPEDIVLNQHNIDRMVAQYAAWRIDKDSEQFFTKVKTIHAKLTEALCLGQTTDQQIPAAIMLNLERETYIFLSLVPCESGKAILRSAVREYGDPTAEIYHQKGSADLSGGLLQNLRVALRGVGTVGSGNDIGMLETIQQRNEDFQRLKNDRQFRSQAKLVTDWAAEAIKIIRFRS